jgi:hypothetical protein
MLMYPKCCWPYGQLTGQAHDFNAILLLNYVMLIGQHSYSYHCFYSVAD